MSGHAINDKVALLDWDFGRRGAEFSDDGHNKVVAQGGDVATTNAVGPIMRTSRPLWTFSPTYLRADRDASNNLLIKWVRRTRAYFVLFSPTGAGLATDGERYEVNVYRTSDNAKVRTPIVTGATSYSYMAAMQTSDGITPRPGAVRVVLYQLNWDVDNPGRGTPAEAVL